MGTIGDFSVCSKQKKKNPRVYGDNFLSKIMLTGVKEKPPCVWGQFTLIPTSPEFKGKTPVCMGTMFLVIRQTNKQRKNPRVYGDNKEAVKSTASYKEKPPCVWGQ